MHQMGPRGPRFFVPPNYDPIDPNYDPLIWRTAGLLGHAMALRDGRGRPQRRRAERALRLLLARLRGLGAARPQHRVPAHRGGQRARRDADQRRRRRAAGLARAACRSIARRSTFPIRGPAATGVSATSSTTTCRRCAGCSSASARYRGELLQNFYRMGSNAVEAGARGGPFAFIMPPEQFDPHAANKLRQLLLDGARRDPARARAVPRRRHGLSRRAPISC